MKLKHGVRVGNVVINNLSKINPSIQRASCILRRQDRLGTEFGEGCNQIDPLHVPEGWTNPIRAEYTQQP